MVEVLEFVWQWIVLPLGALFVIFQLLYVFGIFDWLSERDLNKRIDKLIEKQGRYLDCPECKMPEMDEDQSKKNLAPHVRNLIKMAKDDPQLAEKIGMTEDEIEKLRKQILDENTEDR